MDDLYSGTLPKKPKSLPDTSSGRPRKWSKHSPRLLIRHGIDDLPGEEDSFGVSEDWNISVSEAKPEAQGVVENQLKSIKGPRDEVGLQHAKMAAVTAAVETTIERNEKVVLFCHHIATAQELTAHLASVLPKVTMPPFPTTVWRKAWMQALKPAGHDYYTPRRYADFIHWLCGDLIHAQTWSWLPAASEAELADALRKTRGRHPKGLETIAEAARRLYHTWLKSGSSRAILDSATYYPDMLPGTNGARGYWAFAHPAGTGTRNRSSSATCSLTP